MYVDADLRCSTSSIVRISQLKSAKYVDADLSCWASIPRLCVPSNIDTSFALADHPWLKLLSWYIFFQRVPLRLLCFDRKKRRQMSFFAFLLRSLPALALNNLDGRCLGDCSSQSNQIKIILQDVGGEARRRRKLMKAQRKSSSQTAGSQSVKAEETRGWGAANKFEKINQYGKIYEV